MKRLLLAFSLALPIAGVSMHAHHSFAAHYFEEQSISIQGELVEFEYKSPHAWIHVMAKNGKGELERFSAEWANPNRLKQQGVSKDTLKPGDYVIITGSPGRNPSERLLHLKRIVRPADGWKSGGGRR
ncbi:MAG: hypothetical protein HYU27_06230 [Acidobacteria bacterium]|nr:hypothetical protein [Acidobacteriota bacterium]